MKEMNYDTCTLHVDPTIKLSITENLAINNAFNADLPTLTILA
jgi:hypothetical protein